jgi:hypothetical protein
MASIPFGVVCIMLAQGCEYDWHLLLRFLF